MSLGKAQFGKFSICAFLFFVASIEQAAAPQTTRLGSATAVSGAVKILHRGKTVWELLRKGAAVYTGDKVVTVANGRATITLFDGSVVKVDQDTQVDFSEKSGGVASLKLWFGRVWSNVRKATTSPSKFDVQTAMAVAAVRGTQYEVAVDNEKEQEAGGTEVSVYEGVVEVTDLAEETAAIEDQGNAYQSFRDRYTLRLRARERAKIAAAPMLQRQLRRGIQAVAVAPFGIADEGVPRQAGLKIAQALAAELSEVSRGRLRILDPMQVVKRVGQMGLSTADFSHPMAIQQLFAGERKADVVLLGRVGRWSVPASGEQQKRWSEGRKLRRGEPREAAEGPREAARRKSGVFVVKVRAVLLATGSTLFARRLVLRPSANPSEPIPLGQVADLAQAILRALPRAARIQSVEGDLLRLGIGAADGVQPGQRRIILKRDRDVQDPQTGKVYGARAAAFAVIDQVEPTSCTARVVRRKSGVEVEVGDIAVPQLAPDVTAPLRPLPFQLPARSSDAWSRWRAGQ